MKNQNKNLHTLLFVWIFLNAFLTNLTSQNSVQISQDPATTQILEENIQTSSGLSRFGLNLFGDNALRDESFKGGALTSSYRLGAGDKLGIILGGKAQENFELVVTADGKLYLPTVGVLYVNGLSLSEFRILLDRHLAKFYSNYELNILLLAPKTIGLSVIGEVVEPGNYSGSALNNVVDFISLARGVTENGSLRDIQIFRSDTLVAFIDLYDFLLRPQGHIDFSLQSGDKIFVPILSSSVKIEGQVNREAIYELNPNREETLCDLIDLAGYFTAFALKNKIELSRVDDNGQRYVQYIDFPTISQEKNCRNLILKNNDTIRIFSIKDKVPADSVTILGEVNAPGRYPYQRNMRVSDLILQAKGFTRRAYLLEAEVAKIDPDRSIKKIRIDLYKLYEADNSQQDIYLDPDDYVFIRKIPEWQLGALVEIRGEVKFPGFYPIKEDSTRLSELLREAGGLTKDALIREAKFIRRREVPLEDKEFTRLAAMSRTEMSDSEYEYFVMRQNSENVNEIVVDFDQLVQRGASAEDIILKNGDLIYIPKRPNVVYVLGRVSNPGGILFKKDEGVKYYIAKAGGYTWDANSKRTKIIKVTGEIKSREKVRQLEPGDRIWIPRKNDRDYWKMFYDFVMILGQLAAIYLVIRTATE